MIRCSEKFFKISRFLLVVLISVLVFPKITVNAENNALFELSGELYGVNRLADIELKATYDRKLSAVTIELSYDKTMFEFRSIKAVEDNCLVKAYENQDFVKAVILCQDGIDISSCRTIAVVTLKTLKQGKGEINLKAYDCVDSNVNSIDECSCNNAIITVDKNSSQGRSDGKGLDKASSEKSERTKSNITDVESDTENTQATYDNLGHLNGFSVNVLHYIIVGALAGGALVALILTAYRLGKRSAEDKKDKSDKEDSSK